ncbi:radical SAM protein [uncultured Desulfuromonas sp.]|uniref:radical SAM protein n=1 Tax=uncultured Desulfuromonas sp. TaxID=181013 RepID=UPI0026301FD4|nr:radical SAM protein [uncultured Desulfuromonas sp.]
MACGYSVITYGEFADRLFAKAGGGRLPLFGSMEVTARCNLRCAHCYINEPAGDEAARREELSAAELRGVLDQLVEAGCLSLLLTGGEPFVREDFLDIYTYAKERGLMVALNTNGTTITPEIADHLGRYLPMQVEISIYGATRQTFERVTGVPGSFDRCMRGISLLRERGVPLGLKTAAMTLNRHEVAQMAEFAAGLGLKFRFESVLNLRLDGGREAEAVRLSPEEVVALDYVVPARVEEYRKSADKFQGTPLDPDPLYNCGAGQTMFHIDPNGMLGICMMAKQQLFDLRRGTFAEGWGDFFPEVLAQKGPLESPCRKCDIFNLCIQCPAMAHIEEGDQGARIDYMCRIAHLKAEAFGYQARGPFGQRVESRKEHRNIEEEERDEKSLSQA